MQFLQKMPLYFLNSNEGVLLGLALERFHVLLLRKVQDK